MSGKAVDMRCKSDRLKYKYIKYLIAEGVSRIIIHPTFIHADIDETKPQEILLIDCE